METEYQAVDPTTGETVTVEDVFPDWKEKSFDNDKERINWLLDYVRILLEQGDEQKKLNIRMWDKIQDLERVNRRCENDN